ncbi:MAG: TolC family protein [Cyanobacteria bacterium CRU_2_1]|nr:TolC family protein [Cyanobacteria bacterium CRU_2_1]
MQPSNPLIVVGVSAVFTISLVGTVPTRAEHLLNSHQTHSTIDDEPAKATQPDPETKGQVDSIKPEGEGRGQQSVINDQFKAEFSGLPEFSQRDRTAYPFKPSESIQEPESISRDRRETEFRDDGIVSDGATEIASSPEPSDPDSTHDSTGILEPIQAEIPTEGDRPQSTRAEAVEPSVPEFVSFEPTEVSESTLVEEAIFGGEEQAEVDLPDPEEPTETVDSSLEEAEPEHSDDVSHDVSHDVSQVEEQPETPEASEMTESPEESVEMEAVEAAESEEAPVQVETTDVVEPSEEPSEEPQAEEPSDANPSDAVDSPEALDEEAIEATEAPDENTETAQDPTTQPADASPEEAPDPAMEAEPAETTPPDEAVPPTSEDELFNPDRSTQDELTLPTTPPQPEDFPPTDRPGDVTESEPAPDYLDPDPNPLSFPTEPGEVQLVGNQPITLSQAIELAITNSADLQEARIQLEQDLAALREQEAANLPTVNAGANLNYQGQEQPNFEQEVDPATGQAEIEVDGTDFDDSAVLRGTLEANYNIFTSGRRPALIAAAERQVRFRQLQVEVQTEQLILDVSTAYYDLQQADEQVRIFQAQVEQAQRSLLDAEALERAGVGTRFDVLQAQVDLANAQQDLTNQISQRDIARRQVVELLNLSQSIDISAADPIEVAGVWDLTLEESIVEAYRNRAELEQALVQRELAQENRQAALAQLGPQVSLQASYGLQNTLTGVGTGQQGEDDAEFNGFLSDFQVVLGVNLLLFDGGQSRAQADQAEAQIAIAENQFANTRDQIRFAIEQAYSTLLASFENIQTTSLAVQQAREALRLARLRFQAGVGTQTDVLLQQTALTQAEVNALTAVLDYNRALATLRRNVSNTPEGFLNDVP